MIDFLPLSHSLSLYLLMNKSSPSPAGRDKGNEGREGRRANSWVECDRFSEPVIAHPFPPRQNAAPNLVKRSFLEFIRDFFFSFSLRPFFECPRRHEHPFRDFRDPGSGINSETLERVRSTSMYRRTGRTGLSARRRSPVVDR